MSSSQADDGRRDDPRDPQTLIQSDDAVGESLQLSMPDAAHRHPDAPNIPGYILRELIGQGAYGQVWRAWQVRTRKEVAVKVFTQTSGLDWIFLQREIERLTRLDRHPHIVTLLDANLTGQSPFYAMDLIEGGSLQQFVDPACTAPKRRVMRWKEQLCEALQYVHAKGLLHCDLKPDNILIDEQDNVRVCDFGQSRVFTDAGASFGTLFYMAPEQATPSDDGGTVQPDVRWDIYALGATLYAVLTGHVPHATPENIARLDSATTLEERLSVYRDLCRIPVRAHQSPNPAARVDPELSAVIGMCMAFEPTDRYKTMAGVLRDVAAIKQCRPVSPLAGSVLYRAQKHVQRNPVRLGLACALLVSLVGFAVNTKIQALAIARERDKAVTIADYMIDVFQNPDPKKALGEEITAEDILDQGAEKIKTELAGQPLVRATLMHVMGTVYCHLGLYDKAEPLLQAALTIRRAKLKPHDEALTESLENLAIVYRCRHEGDKAVEFARRALALRREQSSKRFRPANPRALARALHLLGGALEEANELVQAEQCLREAVALRRAAATGQDSRPAELAQSLLNLGRVLIRLQRIDEGQRMITEALEIRRAHLPGYHPAIAATLNDLAGYLWAQQKYEQVEAVMRDALEISRKVRKPDHPIVLDQMNNLARALSVQKKYGQAEALMLEVLRMRRQRFGGDDNVHVAKSLNLLGEHYLDTGALDKARSFFEQALAVRRKVLKPGHPHIGTTMMNLGDVLQRQGDSAAALPLYRETLENWSAKLPAGHHRLAVVESRLGGCLVSLGRLREAESLLLDSLDVIKDHYGDADDETVHAIERLITLYQALDEPDQVARYRAMLPKGE